MSSLQSYSAFPTGGGSNYVSPSQISEIFLKSYTVSSGVTGINISDPLFKLATYKTIHIRINNLTTSGATSTYLGGGPYKNNALVSGLHYYSVEGISSNTVTAYSTSSGTPVDINTIYAYLQSTPSNIDFSNGIGQIDIYLTRQGMTFEAHMASSGNSRRLRGTVTYPTMQTNPAASDYFGLNLGLGSGTFTNGTVNVYGVQ
jgi:hypothetical protein